MITENPKLKILLIGILLVVLVGFQDAVGYQMWKEAGGEGYYKAEETYLKLFWTFVAINLLTASALVWTYTSSVKSAIATSLFPGTLILGGVSDILYFIFIGHPIPDKLPWLNESIILGNVAKLMGKEVVTKNVLMVSAVMSIFGALYLHDNLL